VSAIFINYNFHLYFDCGSVNVKHFNTSFSQQFTSLMMNLRQTCTLTSQQLKFTDCGNAKLIAILEGSGKTPLLLKTTSLLSTVNALLNEGESAPKVADCMLPQDLGGFLQTKQFSLLEVTRNSSTKTLTSETGLELLIVKLPEIVPLEIVGVPFEVTLAFPPQSLQGGGQTITKGILIGGQTTFPHFGVILMK
jgi:hypothetical protein